MIIFNVLHLLYFLKEQRLHLHVGPNRFFLCFLKFRKSVSALASSGKEFQIRGP